MAGEGGVVRSRKPPSALRLFWQSMKGVNGLPGLVIGVFVAVVLGLWVKVTVPLWAVTLGLVVVVIIFWSLVDALGEAVALAKAQREITIVHFGTPLQSYAECHGLFVLHAPDGLPTHATVAFSVWREEVLVPVGFGTVQQQQDDVTYQVTLDRLYHGVDMAELFDRNKTPLDRFTARLEVSLDMAGRTIAPVVKGQTAPAPNRELQPPVANSIVRELPPSDEAEK